MAQWVSKHSIAQQSIPWIIYKSGDITKCTPDLVAGFKFGA